MTISPPRGDDVGQRDADAQQPPRRRLRSWIAGGLLLVLVAAAITSYGLAARYQPVEFGDTFGQGGLGGQPVGHGLRQVNTFGGSGGQLYIPPQKGTFSIGESIGNTGPRAVTIEQVTLVAPGSGGALLSQAGPTIWLPESGPQPPTGTVLHDLVLHPNQYVDIGMQLRMASACYEKGGWSVFDQFYVKERFMGFTHWVTLQLGEPLVMHEPMSGVPGLVCPRR